MAKKIECGKFLVIQCTASEMMNAVGGHTVQCDMCGGWQLPFDDGCYIAVLNQWLCQECFERWQEYAEWYTEDADVERRNYEFYAPRFGIKCQ